MIKIHFPKVMDYAIGWREVVLTEQGLRNNSRVQLVDTPDEADFTFLLCYCFPYERWDATCNLYDPKKTIFLDWWDINWKYFYHIECLLYFKRSLYISQWFETSPGYGYSIKIKPDKRPDNFRPFTYAIMDQFLMDEKFEKTLDIGCFHTEDKNQINRHSVRCLVRRYADHHQHLRIQNKPATTTGDAGRSQFNREYYTRLRQSKIVVTCQPDNWEGDTRTWEAFASGSLVAVDRIYQPWKYPLQDRKHCIIYGTEPEGLEYLYQSLDYYLAHPDELDEVAKCGHEYAMAHHRPVHRLDEIIDQALEARNQC